MKSIYFIIIAVVLISSGCKREEKEISSASAAPAASKDARLNLAATVPKSLDTMRVPGVSIEAQESARDVAWFKETLSHEYGEEAFQSEEKIGDGWVVRYKDDDGLQAAVHRTIADHPFLCRTEGESQAEVEVGLATCRGMQADGANLVVPFALPREGSNLVSINSLKLEVEHADEDSPASADAAFDWKKTGKILKKEKLAGGFAVAYQGNEGDIATNKVGYRAMVRNKVGSLDLLCSNWGVPNSAEEALAAIAHCRTLRVP